MVNRPTAFFAAAGLVLTAAQGIEPDMGTNASARYAHIAAHRGLENTAALLFFVAAALFVLASHAAVRAHLTGRGGQLMGIGQALLGLSAIWLAADRGMSDVIGWAVTDQGTVSAHSAVLLIDMSGGPALGVVSLTFLAMLIGPVLVALALRRAGRTTWLPLVLWVVGIIAYGSAEFRLKAIEIAGLLLATAGLTMLGRALEPSPASSPKPTERSALAETVA